MKRSHSLIALGAVGLVLVAAASFSSSPPGDSFGIPPTSTPSAVLERSSTLSVTLVPPTPVAQPSITLALPTPTTVAVAPILSPTLTTSPSAIPTAPTPESILTPTPTIASTDTPTSTLTPLPSATLTATPTPINLTEAELLRVIDGDTLEVSFDNRTERVRLIGIDSPETNGPPICFGEEATIHAQQLLPKTNDKIWLEKDISETDKYNRLLRYVWLDPARTRMFDEQMVADGYAQVSTYPPDVKYESRFLLAQRTAQASSLGLWGACPYFGAPLPTPTSAALPTSPPSSQGDLPYDPNGPDRDCSDFATHDEAQRFFIAAGGPASDPHRLDADHDGIACESLP